MSLPRLLMSCVLLSVGGAAAAAGLEYVAPEAVAPGAVVVDTRSEQACMGRSVAGAHCLPAADLLGRRGELPSPPDLLWALGTAGLSGRETVLVVGESALARDFVAGLLYLSGQQRVQVLDRPLAAVLGAGALPSGRGSGRGMLRSRVFVAPMRDRLWFLHRDLHRALKSGAPVVPVDGRDEGLSALRVQGRDARREPGAGPVPGAIPGSIKVPLSALEQGSGSAALNGWSERDAVYVAYGRGPMDSIALFARLRARSGADVRVLPGGWREWAAVPGYPAASGAAPGNGDSAAAAIGNGGRVLGVGIVLLAIAMFLAAVTLRRGNRWM